MKKIISLILLVTIVIAGFYIYKEINKKETILTSNFPASELTTVSCVNISSLNKIYCFGGRTPNEGTISNEIFEINTIDKSVTKLDITMPSPLFALSCAEDSSSHMIYCFGGATPINPAGHTYSDEIFEFNPQNNTISSKNALLPTARSGLSCVENSRTHKIYCIGGFDGSYDTEMLTQGKYGLAYYPDSFIMNDQVLEYDPASDKIKEMNSTLPFGRNDLSCTESSSLHKIYCFGGGYADTLTEQIIEYDPQNDAIDIKKSFFNTPRSVASCAENNQNHKLYCFGGSTKLLSDNYTNEIFEYDPKKDTFTQRDVIMPEKIAGHSCVSGPKGKIFCLGGFPRALFFTYERGSWLNPLIDKMKNTFE